MGKLLREPVLHFALLAAALFVWFSLVNDDTPETSQTDKITISDTTVARIVDQFKAVWHRNPTPKELTGLINGAVREEIMVREALALGLDKGDAAIRNRLKQKMQFLTDSAAQSLVPEDDVLRAFLQDNPKPYEIAQRIAFDQVYLGQNPGQQTVDETLSALTQGTDPNTLGQGGLLPGSVPASGQRQIDGAFGTGFAEALAQLEQRTWEGPVKSGYGMHIVRVNTITPATVPEFEAIRDKLLFDWRQNEARALADAQFDAIKARYTVVTPDDAAIAQVLGK